MSDDSELGGDVCCPECGEIQDSYEVYTESYGSSGGTRCLYCHARVEDDDWITD